MLPEESSDGATGRGPLRHETLQPRRQPVVKEDGDDNPGHHEEPSDHAQRRGETQAGRGRLGGLDDRTAEVLGPPGLRHEQLCRCGGERAGAKETND
jgi:hypothetical protein